MQKFNIQNRINEIMDEIVILSQEYLLLKEQLVNKKSKCTQERVHEEYIKQNNQNRYKNNYDIIALHISSFLKESGVPINSKTIYKYLVEEKHVSISYNNLQNNYLKKIIGDKSINVERAYRGYYQYRRKFK